VWASEAVDLITDLQSASDLVATLVTDAEQAITRAAQAQQPSRRDVACETWPGPPSEDPLLANSDKPEAGSPNR
jgi:hypothetical protein